MNDRVILTIEAHVAHVRLNRPDKRNGLDLAMFEAIAGVGERLKGEKGVRAVVLSGEGKVFCAGLDWKSFLTLGADGVTKMLDRPEGRVANLAQQVAWVWTEIPVPVIAALHGAALGGGLQIALGADLRYAHPDTDLSVMEIRYGLIPDMGASQTLLGLVRADVARELTWTGRVVKAPEALALGLVTRVCDDPVTQALESARVIATRSPSAIRAGKRLLVTAPTLGPAESFQLESALQVGLMGSPDQLEATQATLERREPTFEDT